VSRRLRAYRLTEYRAGGVAIRIGRRVPDALFAGMRAQSATMVTAWNPRSRRMPKGWNIRMQRRLRERLRRFVVRDGEGSLDRWREEMLLVAGDPRPVLRLAARFRQHSVVSLRAGQEARLRLIPYHCHYRCHCEERKRRSNPHPGAHPSGDCRVAALLAMTGKG
jgi:hypothetical protein